MTTRVRPDHPVYKRIDLPSEALTCYRRTFLVFDPSYLPALDQFFIMRETPAFLCRPDLDVPHKAQPLRESGKTGEVALQAVAKGPVRMVGCESRQTTALLERYDDFGDFVHNTRELLAQELARFLPGPLQTGTGVRK